MTPISDLVIQHFADLELDAIGDAHAYREVLTIALRLLHEAYQRERIQQRRIEQLNGEVRTLRQAQRAA